MTTLEHYLLLALKNAGVKIDDDVLAELSTIEDVIVDRVVRRLDDLSKALPPLPSLDMGKVAASFSGDFLKTMQPLDAERYRIGIACAVIGGFIADPQLRDGDVRAQIAKEVRSWTDVLFQALIPADNPNYPAGVTEPPESPEAGAPWSG